MRDMVGGDTPNIRAICAATADLIAEMLKHCPDTLVGKRDRALLALGFCRCLPPLRAGRTAGW